MVDALDIKLLNLQYIILEISFLYGKKKMAYMKYNMEDLYILQDYKIICRIHQFYISFS